MFQRTRHPAWMFLLASSLVLLMSLSMAAQQAASQANNPESNNAQTPSGQVAGNSAALPILPVQPKFHGVPWRDPNALAITPFAAPAGAHLTYFGGPVVSNVQVVQVLYGSGSYNPQVAGTSTPSMGN